MMTRALLSSIAQMIAKLGKSIYTEIHREIQIMNSKMKWEMEPIERK
jgi:hypothetical protein